jgi:hypothetical protein
LPLFILGVLSVSVVVLSLVKSTTPDREITEDAQTLKFIEIFGKGCVAFHGITSTPIATNNPHGPRSLSEIS